MIKANQRRIVIVLLVIATAAIAPIAYAALTGDSRFPPPDDVIAANEPTPVGPEVSVATGTVGASTTWSVISYESTFSLCMQLRLTSPPGSSVEANGSLEGCGTSVPTGSAIGYSEAYVNDLDRTWIFGPVAKSVKRVDVELVGSSPLQTTMVTGPPSPSLTPSVDFYYTVVTGQVTVSKAVAYDANGVVVGEKNPSTD